MRLKDVVYWSDLLRMIFEKYNPSIDMSVRETKGVSIFWKNFDTMGFDAIFPAIESLKPSNFRCFLSYIKHKINNWI